VAEDVGFTVRPLSAVEPPPGPGWLVSNPPYGLRVGESDALRNLYAALGRTARAKLPGWTVALLSADRRLEGQTGIAFREAFRTSNGGIPVRLVVGRAD
jgi:putative N6-adenine-specific DNA methylase